MTFSDMAANNPTSLSATLGEEIEIGPADNGTLELLKQLIMPAVLLAFAGYLFTGIVTMAIPEGTDFPGPEFFPSIIAGGLALFAVLLIIGAVKQKMRTVTAIRTGAIVLPAVDEDEVHLGTGAPKRRVGLDPVSLAWVVGGFLAFALLLTFLGWIVGAAALFWCVARGFGEKRPVHSLIVGLTASSISYILFDMLLGLSLPSGLLGWGF